MNALRRGFVPVILLAVLTLSLWSGSLVQAAGPAAPARTPRPSAVPAGTLELTVDQGAGLWAGVQWQDGRGQWRDVDSWQGQLDAAGQQVWTVLENEFGARLFRWQVYDRPGGAALAVSAAFSLPARNETTRVTVALPAPAGDGYPFAAWSESRAYEKGCVIAGQVLDAAGQPLKGYQLRLTYDTGVVETIKSGGAPAYGAGGYAFVWPVFRYPHRYTLQLWAADGQTALSAPQTVSLPGPCRANLAWVVFQPAR